MSDTKEEAEVQKMRLEVRNAADEVVSAIEYAVETSEPLVMSTAQGSTQCVVDPTNAVVILRVPSSEVGSAKVEKADKEEKEEKPAKASKN